MDPDEPKLSRLFILVVALLAIVALKLVWLQVIDAGRLSQLAENNRTVGPVTLNAKRGTIYDRNGNVLAISVDCEDIVCDPTTVAYADGSTDGAASAIADILVEVVGGDRDTYLDALTRENTRYAYLSKRVDESVADELKSRLSEAKLYGVYYESNTKRVYPYGTTGAQVLGYVNDEGVALSGIEYYYDDVLRGTDGQRVYEASPLGTPIAGGVSDTISCA